MSPDDPLVRGFTAFVVAMMVCSAACAVGLPIGGLVLIRRGSRTMGCVLVAAGLFFALNLFGIGRAMLIW